LSHMGVSLHRETTFLSWILKLSELTPTRSFSTLKEHNSIK